MENHLDADRLVPIGEAADRRRFSSLALDHVARALDMDRSDILPQPRDTAGESSMIGEDIEAVLSRVRDAKTRRQMRDLLKALDRSRRRDA